MQNKMLQKRMTEVENGPLARLFRTIGYIALLVVALIAVGLLLMTFTSLVSVEFLENIAIKIIDFQQSNLDFLSEYLGLIFTGGLLLLVWTLSKKLFLPIMTTILVLISVYLHDTFASMVGSGAIIPFFEVPQIDFVLELVVENIWLYPAVLIATSLFAYILLGIKKPKRVAPSLISAAMLILVFYILLQYLPLLLENDWLTNNIYVAIIAGLGTLSFIVMAVGGVFGILGFARK